ncbi:MAG: flagellar biosynthesis protein FliQ [Magnetospirillum sp.]|nr:flagellar biosynthesis protein FliQ [Magnetospirillum sp.]
MTEADLIEIARDTLFTMIVVSAPALLVALAVGVAIAVLQSVTQLQEATLTFVPKVLAIFLSLIIFLPFMLHTMTDFWRHLMDRIAHGGG